MYQSVLVLYNERRGSTRSQLHELPSGQRHSNESRGDLHLLVQVALPEDGDDARAHAEALDALYDKHPRADWD